MSRRCNFNNSKGVQVGHKVSHSNRKNKKRFLPNIQSYSLLSDALGKFVKIKATPSSVRSIEHNDGLDNFLLKTPAAKLSKEAKDLKKKIMHAKQAA